MRALCMSGGGSLGAHSVGVLNYLVNTCGMQYDIITGISAGAINASYLAMFEKGDERRAVTNLMTMWSELEDYKIKKQWFPFSYLTALWKKSIYDSNPLINMLYTSLDINQIRSSGRKIAVGAVCLQTAEYRIFTQDHDSFIEGVVGSAAFPMGLIPGNIDGYDYIDGGIKNGVELQQAIDWGADTLDVVICTPSKTTSIYNGTNTISVGFRGFDLMNDRIMEANLKIAELYNRLVIANAAPDKKLLKINIIRPEVNLPGGGLTFDHNNIMQLMKMGYDDAYNQFKI